MTTHVTTDDERRNDALLVQRALAQLDAPDREAVAYDHASHGCPFFTFADADPYTGLACPVCEPHEFLMATDGSEEAA